MTTPDTASSLPMETPAAGGRAGRAMKGTPASASGSSMP